MIFVIVIIRIMLIYIYIVPFALVRYSVFYCCVRPFKVIYCICCALVFMNARELIM